MKKITNFYVVLLCFLVLMLPLGNAVNVYASNDDLTKADLDKIENYINKQMKESKIPGMSVVIVKGGKAVYKKGFGYSDIQAKKAVTEDTIFELGSTSKAFTGIAVLQLEKQGLINLNDPIDKYLPWLKMKYADKEVQVTVEQALHHTSGIPFKSIDKIPASEAYSALEDTVKTLAQTELASYPGTKYEYATINYDILGLIVQKISGQSYEAYMKKNVLEPAGMNDTYLFRKDTVNKDMAKGYSIVFQKPREYNAPMFRGNTPAGYFMINGNDMGKWLEVQLGTNELSKVDTDLIDKSHTSDTSIVTDKNGSKYATGWFINQSRGRVFHPGNNPSFSSGIVMNPNEKSAVAILANINSDFTMNIAYGIQNILEGNEPVDNFQDGNTGYDKIAYTAIVVLIPFLLIVFFLLVKTCVEIIKKKRKFNFNGIKSLVGYLLTISILGGLEYCLYKAPQILYKGVTWRAAKIWVPKTVYIAALELSVFIILLGLYLIIINLFKRLDDKSYFSIIILSVASGLGNSLVVMMVNESLNNSGNFQVELFMVFILGIALYVIGQKIVRSRLIKITNKVVYELRIDLLNKILGSSYENLEKVESGKIQAAMNNDTELISNFPNIMVAGATSLITLICCFIYLGFISVYGLLLSIVVIAIISSIYFIAGSSANKLWESTRDMQNVFFKYITDVVGGFKELKLNDDKAAEFKEDMNDVCINYREKKSKANISFANVFIIGELLFTSAVGVVAFLFPIVFKELQVNSLRGFILVLLYMTGPVNGLLNIIPSVIQIRISWKRVNALIKELSGLAEEQIDTKSVNNSQPKIKLQLKDVEYEYSNENGDSFKVGPINYTFNSGEVIFVTGGNGSGKSTLAKLITGLYSPKEGELYLNDKLVASTELSQNYSTVFSDFYLFDKMYGIDYKSKEEEINKYLDKLQVKDKVQIVDGLFSTTKLSTGQRKRLALMISYLEDRPIYLFDEWAADQDPVFRKFFYMELLPGLKKRGKCIIAITHDDRYFKTADKVIKMEFGKIVEEDFANNYSNIAATIQS